MILATSTFGVMQVSVHQVIGMVAVRYGFMTAARAMFVRRVVTAAVMAAGRGAGVSGVDGNDMLIHVSFVQVMQVPVMQVIGVSLVLDSGMAASWAVLMRVRVMFVALLCHQCLLRTLWASKPSSALAVLLITDGVRQENDVQ